jgi:CTP:molybdopterin cytidylyltransferase MocA
MMQVLVMAQGRQSRLANVLDGPKHLVKVDGEPILARTLRLETSLGVGARRRPVVVGWPGMRPACDSQGARLVTLHHPGTSLLFGLLQTTALWSPRGRTIVLLGDVVFSAAAMAAILAERRPLVFAGTTTLHGGDGELYALAFDAAAAAPIVETLRDFRPAYTEHEQPGQLRRLLWSYMARTGRTWTHPHEMHHPDLYLPIDDWTKDIDTPDDLTRLEDLTVRARQEGAGDVGRTARQ